MSSAPQTNNQVTPAAAVAAAPTPIIPAAQVMLYAAQKSIELDKAIYLDYYIDTAQGKAFLGEDSETKERMLVKSGDEFTSIVKKVYKVQEEFVVETENSLYIISGKVQRRRIQAPALRGY